MIIGIEIHSPGQKLFPCHFLTSLSGNFSRKVHIVNFRNFDGNVVME